MQRTNRLLVAVLMISVCLAFGQLQASSSVNQVTISYPVGTLQGSYTNSRGTYQVTVYYPALRSGVNAPADGSKHAAVVFAPGFAAIKDFYKWVGNQLASSGYVVAIFTPPNTLSLDIAQWSDGISSGIDYLLSLSTTRGMVDPNRIGAMGHSMGGGAAILATANDKRIKATVALAPGNSNLGSFIFAKAVKAAFSITVPVQIQVGSDDRITPKISVHEYYVNIPASVAKEYVEIKGGGHIQFVDSLSMLLGKIFYRDATTTSTASGTDVILTAARQHEISAPFFTAWFQYFLNGQQASGTYNQLFGTTALNALNTGILSALQFVDPPVLSGKTMILTLARTMTLSSSTTTSIISSSKTTSQTIAVKATSSTAASCTLVLPVTKRYAMVGSYGITITITDYSISSDGKHIHAKGTLVLNAPVNVQLTSQTLTLTSGLGQIGFGAMLSMPKALIPGQPVPFEEQVDLNYSIDQLRQMGVQQITVHSDTQYCASFMGCSTFSQDETHTLNDLLCGRVF